MNKKSYMYIFIINGGVKFQFYGEVMLSAENNFYENKNIGT